MSVTDLSWVARQSGNTFDLAEASHLYLARWETKAVLLRYPHCAHWSHKWGVGGGPIWTDLVSCQLSPRWLETLLDYRQPSKDACPPAPPEWAAAVRWAPLASLLPVKEAKSDGLNPPTTHQLWVLSECINKCTFHGVDVQGLCRCGSVMLA